MAANGGASATDADGPPSCFHARTSIGEPTNGSRPVSASNSITPTLYQSAAGEAPRPSSSSGAM